MLLDIMLKRNDTRTIFKLLGKLFQVLGPKQNKRWIPSFVFRKGIFNVLLEEHLITLFSPTGQKSSSK